MIKQGNPKAKPHLCCTICFPPSGYGFFPTAKGYWVKERGLKKFWRGSIPICGQCRENMKYCRCRHED